MEPKRRVDIEARVAEDIRRGDFGAAKERLVSRLQSKGYDAALLSRLGDICLEMHDPFEAGRFWLASDRTDEQANKAIGAFLAKVHRHPRAIVTALPSVIRAIPWQALPEAARTRLNEAGVREEYLRRSRAARAKIRLAWRERLGIVFAALALLFFIAVMVAGIIKLQEIVSDW